MGRRDARRIARRVSGGPSQRVARDAIPLEPNAVSLLIDRLRERGDDRRVSFMQPTADAPDDRAELEPRLDASCGATAAVLEFRPTSGLSARWEVQSVRDLRDYGDSTTIGAVTSRAEAGKTALNGANAGFERERTMFSSISFAPAFSAWFHPRVELGTQYEMLRDPNVQSLVTLPGVVGVDSVLAARDSTQACVVRVAAAVCRRHRRCSSARAIDVTKLFTMYSRDSSAVRRIGSLFAPVDVSYTRSLISTLDAAPVGAPLLYQLGLGGVGSAFRRVNGIDATAAGQTGNFVQRVDGAAAAARHVDHQSVSAHGTTLNWIGAGPIRPRRRSTDRRHSFPTPTAFRWRISAGDCGDRTGHRRTWMRAWDTREVT